MKRKIIKINSDECIGCGLCVTACHERAIGLKDGKAVLLRDDYCDGLGDCLPSCPVNAISFEEREALPYDDAAVKANIASIKAAEEGKAAKMSNAAANSEPMACGCPSSQHKSIKREEVQGATVCGCNTSRLSQWPVQIRLVPTVAPYYNNADLLIAADCTAYAYGNFHSKFIDKRATIIGCPKLDALDYSEKLAEIIKNNNIKSITLVRMEVPCCGGLENAVKKALEASGKKIPLSISMISVNGEIIN